MFAHKLPMAFLLVENDPSDASVFVFFPHPLAQKTIF
jgi:hypothetical protein